MGFYLNPPADSFQEVLNTDLYVDKTGLIAYTNSVLGTAMKLTCFSRPRRFGKSFAAKMLAAYYSKGANSKEIFKDLKIAKNTDFEKHINNYDVLFLDITWFISNALSIKDTVIDMQRYVLDELREAYPNCVSVNTRTLPIALSQISSRSGTKFFIIIDEWDALFREAKEDTDLQKSYIQLLRGLFKGVQVSQFLVGAYMTGILPIKKYGTQSALTDFFEYTMVEPGPLGEFVGFTEEDVTALCEKYGIEFEDAHKWYDGYRFSGVGHIYNPNSIIKAVLNCRMSNYWTQTETYEALRIYIDMDFDGLKTAVVEMLGGKNCVIDTGTFQNDLTSLKSRDDVFTLLVHLGYLAHDADRKEVFIPNEEVREEFIRAIKHSKSDELVKAIRASDELLDATIRMDSDTVARLLEDVHNTGSSPHYYNNEQALRSVVLMAYLSAKGHYSMMQELSMGTGYADILFLPNKDSDKPALIVELKWNKTPKAAIAQIKERRYAQILENFQGDILLVGINYNVKSKKHECVIEKYNRKSKAKSTGDL